MDDFPCKAGRKRKFLQLYPLLFFTQMSAADVMMYEVFESSLMQDATLLDKFPKIKACRQKVKTCKKMEEYLGKRKQTPF